MRQNVGNCNIPNRPQRLNKNRSRNCQERCAPCSRSPYVPHSRRRILNTDPCVHELWTCSCVRSCLVTIDKKTTFFSFQAFKGMTPQRRTTRAEVGVPLLVAEWVLHRGVFPIQTEHNCDTCTEYIYIYYLFCILTAYHGLVHRSTLSIPFEYWLGVRHGVRELSCLKYTMRRSYCSAC